MMTERDSSLKRQRVTWLVVPELAVGKHQPPADEGGVDARVALHLERSPVLVLVLLAQRLVGFDILRRYRPKISACGASCSSWAPWQQASSGTRPSGAARSCMARTEALLQP